jgi:phosphoenolpyruvate carboxylase
LHSVSSRIAVFQTTVYIASRGDLTSTAADLAQYGSGSCQALQADISSDESIAELAASLKEDEGRLDVLVNNAALGGFIHEFDDFPMHEFDTMTSVNLRGPFALTQACLPLLREAADAVPLWVLLLCLVAWAGRKTSALPVCTSPVAPDPTSRAPCCRSMGGFWSASGTTPDLRRGNPVSPHRVRGTLRLADPRHQERSDSLFRWQSHSDLSQRLGSCGLSSTRPLLKSAREPPDSSRVTRAIVADHLFLCIVPPVSMMIWGRDRGISREVEKKRRAHNQRASRDIVGGMSESAPQSVRDWGSDRSHDGLPAALRDDVRLLGQLLGQVFREHRGVGLLDTVEGIRTLAKEARRGGDADWERLSAFLTTLPDSEILDVARAFNQFLNLANIAEQHHVTQRADVTGDRDWEHLGGMLNLAEALAHTRVEVVLTAHPTEVLRRTLIQKYDEISELLRETASARRDEQLQRVIAEAWHTDEIRQERPSPQDEARSGFAVVENALWEAVPAVLRDVDAALVRAGGGPLPVDVAPIAFASWMGGDRDGNPNVTAEVTHEVLMLARWMAADLYLRDVERLLSSLSMHRCTQELEEVAGTSHEPYRALLKGLRERLTATRDWAEAQDVDPEAVITDVADLREPLELCFRSLVESGMETIARGPLLDTLRRAHCFGIELVRLDIRQHAERHAQVLDELLAYLEPGQRPYAEWSERERREFLLRELVSPRPLFPAEWPMTTDAREVLDTCSMIAARGGAGIAGYIISMAATPSDVLAVILLLREAGLETNLPIVPLFETLDDLDRASETLDELLGVPWYREYVAAAGDRQQVMIGYSDSAKDAGQFAAAWAQYRAQERLTAVAARHGVALTLFHGRGGAIGRGGGPSQQAILSQPPGSVGGSLRVTEQGEMIRFKLGTPAVAVDTVTRYLSATVQATFRPPPQPEEGFRQAVDQMANAALTEYRQVVRADADFVPFFQALTPEQELADLAIGSRPARRKATQDIESLRAIPWVFAWTQVRLMLPAWLGTEAAFGYLAAHPGLYEQLTAWPFFRMQAEMLEMMLAKIEPSIVRYYAARLTSADQQNRAEALIAREEALARELVQLRGTERLLADQPDLVDSLLVRNTYLDPLHLLQAELLVRRRAPGGGSAAVTQALKVTMAGIASGLRNTG